ncbi:hypothetical protein FJY90_02890 [Candidatus Gottesmanbacteria bacterium]|nr:hypothetical protein [Candidatus Gottesmanbacteria bacterium]
MPINAFNDIEAKPILGQQGIGGFDDLRRVAILEVGTGSRAIKADPESGLWVGANKWADAPFRVAMDGTVVIGSGYSKISIFKQDGIPTSTSIGDIWFDTDDANKVYRAASVGADQIVAGEWELVRDTGIAQALTDAAQAIADAATAQATADGKVTTFYQTSAPTAEGVGDLWIDTDDGNKLYRWSGSAWVEIQDDDIATAIANAATAQATADSKVVTFYQAAIPTSTDIGDLWMDTDDNNKLYRAASVGADQIVAGEWEAVDDQRAADALLKSTNTTLSAVVTVGLAGVQIDGTNKRILINDGSNNRIVIGNV